MNESLLLFTFSATKTSDRKSTEEPSTPARRMNKENELGTPNTNNKVRPMSMKMLRYTPVVNSPLLNDITDETASN